MPELAADIKANGQRVKIQLLDGKVIDGRRRLAACKLIGFEPQTEAVQVNDPVDYVVSLNLHRRHLTISEASMCGARAGQLKERFAAEAKERQRASGGDHGNQYTGGKKPEVVVPNWAQPPIDSGKTRDKLAAQFGVSHGSLDRAEKVLKEGVPELVSAVDTGKVAVSTAAKIATQASGRNPGAQGPPRQRFPGRPGARKASPLPLSGVFY